MMAIYYFLSVNRAHLRTEGELIIIIIIMIKAFCLLADLVRHLMSDNSPYLDRSCLQLRLR